MRYIFCILFCLFTLVTKAQVTDTPKVSIPDTLKKDLLTIPDTVPHLHSRTASLIPPAVMVAYGAGSFAIHPLRRLDHWVYGEAEEHDVITPIRFENFFQYAPVALTYGLNLVGVHGKNTFVDRTIIYVTAQSMLQLTLITLKKNYAPPAA